jgi:hypothetical protein
MTWSPDPLTQLLGLVLGAAVYAVAIWLGPRWLAESPRTWGEDDAADE